ncbi:MAG: hypothetical protein EXQ89_02875 [Rhodospirillaceae bacterium]|nr:hypothetical protein [Rhodospirillaceae bacterium]
MDRAWRKFLNLFLATAMGSGAILYVSVLLIDPYDIVWFSPALDRAPVTTNQRFSFPALARKSRFDSAIIGTSMTRMLKPAELNETIGGGFVNLSMNSGTAYEQARILEVFARHHPAAGAVLFGVDGTWCERQDAPLLTPRPFPEWMYDDSRWNDLLHLFNFPAIEESGRQFAHIVGIKTSRNGLDGYTNFLPPLSTYDLAKVRLAIYGPAGPREPDVGRNAPIVETAAALRFPSHELMVGMLRRLAPETSKILVLVPYHRFFQPAPGSDAARALDECKRRLTALAAGFANSHVLDFMIDSEITRRDENYWDNLHYSEDIATQLAHLIARGIRERRSIPGAFAYRGGGPPA